MAGMSKNNPDARKNEYNGKMVTSDICEKCKNPCTKGLNYIKVFRKKLEGKGVFCKLR